MKIKIPPIVETDAEFRVIAQPGKFRVDAPWWVVRARDNRVMTEGSVVSCLRWVTVWGPMRR